MASSRPLVLVVIDGFGLSLFEQGNAVKAANTPHLTRLMQEGLFGVLEASGMSVGVMWGEVGNSEVGHLGLGAGQVVYQNLPRIHLTIEDGSFFRNSEFIGAIEEVKRSGGTLHLVGLASSGGVHAHIEHLEKLLELAVQQSFNRVAIHMITDGRDTPAQMALQFVRQIEEKCRGLRVGKIATVTGRFYAMDRNENWDRTEKAYHAIMIGAGPSAESAEQAVEQSYKRGVFDEQIEPTVILDGGKPVATIGGNDAVIFFNYREDRARQLTKAFVLKEFTGFHRSQWFPSLRFVTMIEYEKGLPARVAFPPQHVSMPFGSVIAQAGWKQLRLAETEKYAHVTYFFNGGNEQVYPGEERKTIPSKKVVSYDTVPEMSAREITAYAIETLKKNVYQFLLINYANPDMVGHTGNFERTVTAVETVDACIGELRRAIEAGGGTLTVTADHGNAEQKVDPTSGNPSKEHTANPVPFILHTPGRPSAKSAEELTILLTELTPVGILADVAPTLLNLVGLPVPEEMTGKNIIDSLL